MNDTNNNTNFKVIQIVNGSLIMGVLVFLGVTLNSIGGTIFDYQDGSVFMYLVPGFFVGAVFLSNLLFQKKMAAINSNDTLFQKLTNYQMANIMRGAPLEASGLAAVAGIMLTSNLYYLIFVGLAVLMMAINFPTKLKFENIIDLSLTDLDQLKGM